MFYVLFATWLRRHTYAHTTTTTRWQYFVPSPTSCYTTTYIQRNMCHTNLLSFFVRIDKRHPVMMMMKMKYFSGNTFSQQKPDKTTIAAKKSLLTESKIYTAIYGICLTTVSKSKFSFRPKFMCVWPFTEFTRTNIITFSVIPPSPLSSTVVPYIEVYFQKSVIKTRRSQVWVGAMLVLGWAKFDENAKGSHIPANEEWTARLNKMSWWLTEELEPRKNILGFCFGRKYIRIL